jgi:hypothetical protein
MLRMPFVLCLTLLAAPVRAQEVLTADDFQALSEGRTLHFTLGGLPFGSEQYFSDRRSLWRTPDGECEAGRWTPRGEAICFVYDANPDPQCWRFTRAGGQVRAHFVEDGIPDPYPVLLDRIDDAPLDCPGPRVGS